MYDRYPLDPDINSSTRLITYVEHIWDVLYQIYDENNLPVFMLRSIFICVNFNLSLKIDI